MGALTRRRRKLSRIVGVAMLVYNLWRRLPRRGRRKLLRLAGRHGPVVARKAYGLRARRRRYT